MALLEFQDLSFDEEKERVFVRLMRLFEFSIPKEELGDAKIGSNSVETGSPGKFNNTISRHILGLKNRLTGRDAVYIHRNSGIPLMGTLYFGIVDRGTDMLEVKLITGCNIDCVFCSVGEGLHSRKETDYVVEDDYIAEELEKLLDFKARKQKGLAVKVFINPHGEPLLYANIVQLVGKISRLRHVKAVSIITNGTMLTENLVDGLKEAGLAQLNISMNSLNQEKAQQLSGMGSYDIERLKHVIEYAAGKLEVMLAPVWVKGLNDEDIEELIMFAKKNGCRMGIQKFIAHKRGRKPAEEEGWEEFYDQLEAWQKRFGIELRHREGIPQTKELPMPFMRNDKLSARIVCAGRRKGEMIAAARGRCIAVQGCSKKPGEKAKIRIRAAKNNVFAGEMI